MHFKMSNRRRKIRGAFAGMAAVMAMTLMLAGVPAPVLYAEQTDGAMRPQEAAQTADQDSALEGEYVPEDGSAPEEKYASEKKTAPADKETGEEEHEGDSEKSVTSPNAEGQPEKPEESSGKEETTSEAKTVSGMKTASEAETVSANVMAAVYDLRAAEDKSGGLDFQWRSSLPKVETEYTAGGGRIVWTPKLEGSNVVSGTLTLQNAEIDANETGIRVCVPTTVVLEGESLISAGKTNSNAPGMSLGLAFEQGLEYLDGSVITGSGSLKIQSPGDGIQSPKGFTIDGAQVSIVYGSGADGIWTSDADIMIKNNSLVEVTGAGSAGVGALRVQGSKGDIIIENSKVIAINNTGAAMSTVGGNIRLISSDVRAVGNTSSQNASGTLLVAYGKHIIMDGGMLYAENTGGDLEIPLMSGCMETKNGAVFYTREKKYLLPIQGGAVWYPNSSYDKDKDLVTAGIEGEVIGNMVWQEGMPLPENMTLSIGRYYDDVTLTIPEGVNIVVPNGSKINVRPNAKGSLINNGTIDISGGGNINVANNGSLTNGGTVNIQDGGSLYNSYNTTTGERGTIENNGTIQVFDSGVLQNYSNLTNNGAIRSTGSFYNILAAGSPGSIINSGTIDGFVIEMQDTAYINKANGNTVIKKGQTLILGANADSTRSKSRTLQVLDGATLTVEEGAVVDAKTHVTQDTLSQYLKIDDTLVLNGTLLLPDNTPEAVIQELGQHIEGDGSIQVGDVTGGSNYYIAQVAGSAAGNTGKGLYQERATVNIDAGDKAGYRFLGWTAVPENVAVTDAQAVRTTFIMPKGSVTLTANWEQITYEVTVNGSKAAVTGAGVYAAGEVVSVDAGSREGYAFKGWSSGDGVAFADPSQAATTFVMPGHPVTVTASWGEKPEETTSSPEETTPSPEETTSSGGTGSSSGNQSSSSGTDGKQKNPQPAANPEETLPIAETNETQNQNVSAAAASADTGDASHMGWYLLSGILSLSGCMAMIRRLTKNTLD